MRGSRSAPGTGLQRIKGAIAKRRRMARGALFWIEAIAAIATVMAIAVGLVNHFDSGGETKLPGEGKRIIAFRQVTNRICTENRQNLHRALVEAGSRLERLEFVARAIGWDVNDLESITAPPTRFDAFVAEVT